MRKYWEPLPWVTEYLVSLCRDSKLVVDVGGRKDKPFPAAKETIGFEGDCPIDLEYEPLPYEDGEVDFLYCRHTVEDLANPTHLLREIQRVAKRGYIETPSPLAETTRGVDAGGDHLGYRHHRWICAERDGVFALLAKYPVIERMPVRDHWERLMDEPDSWNTGMLFDEFEFEVYQNEQGFVMHNLCPGRHLPSDYLGAINHFVNDYEPFKAPEYEPERIT